MLGGEHIAKVILICGKIGSGKTEYAKSLMKSNPAVLLSVDEITFSLFGANVGEEHNLIVEKTQKYLLKKSLEIIDTDINVILDWGFWTREDRREATDFYKKYNITIEWHYIDVSNDMLRENLNKRNFEIEEGKISFYHFDDELASRFWEMFEIPDKNEIDVWVMNRGGRK